MKNLKGVTCEVQARTREDIAKSELLAQDEAEVAGVVDGASPKKKARRGQLSIDKAKSDASLRLYITKCTNAVTAVNTDLQEMTDKLGALDIGDSTLYKDTREEQLGFLNRDSKLAIDHINALATSVGEVLAKITVADTTNACSEFVKEASTKMKELDKGPAKTWKTALKEALGLCKTLERGAWG